MHRSWSILIILRLASQPSALLQDGTKTKLAKPASLPQHRSKLAAWCFLWPRLARHWYCMILIDIMVLWGYRLNQNVFNIFKIYQIHLARKKLNASKRKYHQTDVTRLPVTILSDSKETLGALDISWFLCQESNLRYLLLRPHRQKSPKQDPIF